MVFLLFFFTGQEVSWDDFLPSLSYVIVECNRPHILIEVEYMMELLEPSWLGGEGMTWTFKCCLYPQNLSICLSVYQSVNQSVSQSVSQYIFLSIYRPLLNNTIGSKYDYILYSCLLIIKINPYFLSGCMPTDSLLWAQLLGTECLLMQKCKGTVQYLQYMQKTHTCSSTDSLKAPMKVTHPRAESQVPTAKEPQPATYCIHLC